MIFYQEFLIEIANKDKAIKQGIPLVTVRFLKFCDGFEAGGTKEYTKEFAEKLVAEGFAEIINQNPDNCRDNADKIDDPSFPLAPMLPVETIKNTEKVQNLEKQEKQLKVEKPCDLCDLTPTLPTTEGKGHIVTLTKTSCDLCDLSEGHKQPICDLCDLPVTPLVTLPKKEDLPTREEKINIEGHNKNTYFQSNTPFFDKNQVNIQQIQTNIQFSTQVGKILMFMESRSNQDFILAILYESLIRKVDLSYKDISLKSKIKYDDIKKYIYRLENAELIIKKLIKKNIYVTITQKGKEYIEELWKINSEKQEQQNKSLKKSDVEIIYDNLVSFFESNENQNKLIECIRKEEPFDLNYFDLLEYNITITEYLMYEPDNFFKLVKVATEDIISRYGYEKGRFCPIHIVNLPNSKNILVGSIRTKDVDKFICIQGDLKQKSVPQPEVVKSKTECTRCGEMRIYSGDQAIPQRCQTCEFGYLKVVEEVKRDMQRVVVEERLDSYEEERQPRKLNCVLYDENANYENDKKLVVGQKIKINGILRVIKTEKKKVGQRRTYNFMLEINHFEMEEETFSELKITEEDIKKIEEIKKDKNLITNFYESIWGDIHKRDEIKKALLLQEFVCPPEKTKYGIKKRMYSHILLIGDAGQGKSLFLKGVKKIAPKWRMAVGGGTTGVGLIGATIKDPFLDIWMLEAGAFPSANHGILMIDEFDKVSHEDRQHLHQGMEEGEATITKANIQATLPCEASVLACANPKYGRFDPFSSVLKQIDMPSTLLSRFDLIFVLRDIPDADKDKLVAEKILNVEKEESHITYDNVLIKKYIAYARQNYHPKLTEKQKHLITAKYSELRKFGYDVESNTVSFTPRQLQGGVRLIKSSAMFHLRNDVQDEDIQLAFDLITESLMQVALNKEGRIDTNIINTGGVQTEERVEFSKFEQLVSDFKKGVRIYDYDLIEKAMKLGISDEIIVQEIQKMKRDGLIVEYKDDNGLYYVKVE